MRWITSQSRATALPFVTVVLVVGLTACSESGNGETASGDPAADASTGSAGCQVDMMIEPGSEIRELVHDDLVRAYSVHVPERYDGETPAPLVFSLHGFGGDPESQDEGNGLPAEAGARGYIVVTPQAGPLSLPGVGPDVEEAAEFEGIPFWNFFGSGEIEFGGTAPEGYEGVTGADLGADDVGFFRVLIDELLAEYCVDAERVFSTGMSNGAGMSTVLACELDDRIRAIGPVAGVNLTGVCSGTEPVSVLAVHGDADEAVLYDGNGLLGFELGNPSVPDRMSQWAEHDGCDIEPVVEEQANDVTVTRWPHCDEGTEVELWTLAGWGHVWPVGADAPVDATVAVLDFFDRVSGRSARAP